jgi:hypothetical protein
MKKTTYFFSGLFLGVLGMTLFLFGLGETPTKPGEITQKNVAKSLAYIPSISGFSAADFARSLHPGVAPADLEGILSTFLVTGKEDSCMMLLNDAGTKMALPHWQRFMGSADSLIPVMNWTEDLSAYQPRNPGQRILFEAMADFWFQTIAQRLDSIGREEPAAKFTFPYRYLTERCAHHNHLVNVPITKWEKGVNRLLETRLAYLVNRLLLDVHPFLLILIGLFLVLTAIGWVTMGLAFLRFVKVRRQNQKKNHLRSTDT